MGGARRIALHGEDCQVRGSRRHSSDMSYLGKRICDGHFMDLSAQDDDGTALCAALGLHPPTTSIPGDGPRSSPLPTARI